MTNEQRLDQLEKRNKRLTVALTMMAVTICAVVTMAATKLKDGHFDMVTADTVIAEYVAVTNHAGEYVVSFGVNDDGGGLVRTYSAKGKN